jgi:1,4-alpha-glucan branching enzyme
MAYEDEHFIDSSKLVWTYSFFTDEDIQLFRDGMFTMLMRNLAAIVCVYSILMVSILLFGHRMPRPYQWWESLMAGKKLHPLYPRLDKSGIWEDSYPVCPQEANTNTISAPGDFETDKADPFARHCEFRPGTASITWDIDNTGMMASG